VIPKNAVIFGLANKRSIAWPSPETAPSRLALAITYQNERIELEPGPDAECQARGVHVRVTKDDEIADC